MSTCISRHGEYSSHEPGPDYNCTQCHELDEAGMRTELAELQRQRDDVLKLCDDADWHDKRWLDGPKWIPTDRIREIYASKGEERA